MSTKELILAELDSLSQEELEELYALVKQYLETQRQGPTKLTFLERLGQIQIDGPEDFSEMVDGNAWDVLEKLTGSITAPEDWAAEHDHYLYGTSKRHDV
jgi:hypothetical protein